VVLDRWPMSATAAPLSRWHAATGMPSGRASPIRLPSLESWVCSLCTFRGNQQASTACEVCQAPRAEAEQKAQPAADAAPAPRSQLSKIKGRRRKKTFVARLRSEDLAEQTKAEDWRVLTDAPSPDAFFGMLSSTGPHVLALGPAGGRGSSGDQKTRDHVGQQPDGGEGGSSLDPLPLHELMDGASSVQARWLLRCSGALCSQGLLRCFWPVHVPGAA
jgi:hypothetical protein